MGNKNDSKKHLIDIDQLLIETNDQTKTEKFFNKTSYMIEFSKSFNNPFQEIFKNGYDINAEIFEKFEGNFIFTKTIKISFENFIEFRNLCNDFMCVNRTKDKCDNIDDNNSSVNEKPFEINKKNSITPGKDDDENSCLICLERKSDVVLECYHSYCEKCIKSWLNNKRNTCPLCRKSINMNTFSFNTWDLLEDTSDSVELISSVNMKFYEILYKLFTSNLKDGWVIMLNYVYLD